MTNPDELEVLLSRYLAGQATPDEARQVAEWSAAQEELEPALRLSGLAQAHLKARLWHRIEVRIEAEPATILPGAGWLRWAAAAAAVVAVLGLGALQLAQGPLPTPLASRAEWQSFYNAADHVVAIHLADGSTVQLAPHSRLTYPGRFDGRGRAVRLDGEAFFSVHHDAAHPFRVYTAQVVTTVLGTSFRVVAPAGQARAVVQVRTGRVRVTPHQPDSAAALAAVVLLPNQQTVYAPDAGRSALRRELVAAPRLLHPRSFVFADRPATEVLDALHAAYGVDIRYDAARLAHCTVNLKLTQPSLHAKLRVLCEVLDATYQETDGTIRFRGGGCPQN